MTINQASILDRPFSRHPVHDMQELVDHFGLPPLRRAAALAVEVSFTGLEPEQFKAAVCGHRVSYDRLLFPGESSCDCGESHELGSCDHLGAVAMLVLGRGRLPDEAEAGFPSLTRGYPKRDRHRDFWVNEAQDWFDGREPLLSDDEARRLTDEALSPLQSLTTDDGELERHCDAAYLIAARLVVAGRKDEAVRMLQAALRLTRAEVRARLVDHARTTDAADRSWLAQLERGDIDALDWPIRLALIYARPPRTRQLLDWLKSVIDAENPMEQSFSVKCLWSLVGDEGLRDILDWFGELGRESVPDWERKFAVAKYFGDEALLAELAAHPPAGVHRRVLVHHRNRPPTAESVAALAGYLDEGLVTADRTDRTSVDVHDFIDWLTGSPLVEAAAVLRRISIECFRSDRLWESMDVMVRASGRTEATRRRAHDLANIPVDGNVAPFDPADRWDSVVIDSHFLEPDPDLEMLDADAAATWMGMDALDVAKRLADRFPATAINLAMGAAMCFAGQRGASFDVVSCFEVAFRIRTEQDKPWKYWHLLMMLEKRGVISDVVRLNLTLAGLWPDVRHPVSTTDDDPVADDGP